MKKSKVTVGTIFDGVIKEPILGVGKFASNIAEEIRDIRYNVTNPHISRGERIANAVAIPFTVVGAPITMVGMAPVVIGVTAVNNMAEIIHGTYKDNGETSYIDNL